MRFVIFQLFAFANFVHSANILGITQVLSHSHHLWNEILAEGLLAHGHNITYLSLDPAKLKHEKYTVFEVTGAYEAVQGSMNIEDSPNNPEPFSASELWLMNEYTCSIALKSDALKLLDSYPKDYKFDLILWDVTAGQCLYPLIKRFGNPPVVGISPFGLQAYISSMFGDHLYSYIPIYVLAITDRMSLWEKIQNVYITNAVNWQRYKSLDVMRNMAIEYFGEDVDDFNEIERNFTVALVNSNAILNYPQALAPNIISVGGLHVRKPKPIHKDVQRIIDESKHGVIYFALGSNLKAEKVSKSVLESMNKCFETLPQTILWKINATNMKLPKNVKAFPWYAQNDILAHPKTILFISHGGALSTQEAMHHGVPIVGIPFFLDQISNVEKLVHRRIAERIEFRKITPDYVCSKIKKVLSDPTYRKNVKTVSSRLKDQQETPLERAVFWIEYILRHKTAEHLTLAIRDMNVFESTNLDLVLVALLSLIGIVFVLIISIKFIAKMYHALSIKKLKAN